MPGKDDKKEQKDTINKMQNALITVLANMVENRDKFTGNHVKNTAAYARIISASRTVSVRPSISRSAQADSL